jgi:TRAP-type C4-dicarboxylate transport system permease large subunit
VGVVGATIVAYGSGKLSFDLFKGAAKAAALATGMIVIIIISSQLFSQLIAFSGVSSSIQSLLTSSAIRGWMLAALLLFIQFALCTVLDEIAVMLILVPIYIPLLHLTGMDPIWFWTIFLVNISLGGIAPPVGYVLFVFQGVVKSTSITELYQASLPYVAIYLAAMAVLVGWGVWVGP